MIDDAPYHRGGWPRWMRAQTAADYVDEPSTRAFRRKVGTVYPDPCHGKGKGAIWDRLEIDKACGRRTEIETATTNVVDAASLL